MKQWKILLKNHLKQDWEKQFPKGTATTTAESSCNNRRGKKYSKSKKTNFITKTVNNEDDEDFEEIECPKEEASAMFVIGQIKPKKIIQMKKHIFFETTYDMKRLIADRICSHKFQNQSSRILKIQKINVHITQLLFDKINASSNDK